MKTVNIIIKKLSSKFQPVKATGGLIAFFMLLIINSCSESNLFFRDGDDMTLVSDYLEFQRIDINARADLMLIQDTVSYIRIVATKPVLEKIGYHLSGDTLFIREKKDIQIFTSKKTTFIYIHLKDLKHLTTHRPVRVYNQDTLNLTSFTYWPLGEIGEADLAVNCDRIALHTSANTLGNFWIKGRSDVCQLFNRYGCSIFADSLKVRYAEVLNESIGDVYVNASEKLRVYIWGTGTIYYYGHPEVEIVEKKESGRVVSLVQ